MPDFDHAPQSAHTAPQSAPWLLRVEDLYRRFVMGEVTVEVLKGISFDIHENEFLAIVGPSGSGKTTVLNMIGGLDQPNQGKVLFRNGDQVQDLAQATPAELTEYRREQVGFVFQFYNLVPNLTAAENVMIAADISRSPRDVDEVLELVGLADRSQHFPAQLSGGEQQRVAIARAVAKSPQLLLCDEPTGALDYQTGKVVLRLLADLHQQLGTTVVVITHNGALAEVTQRVIQLRSGSVAQIADNPHPKPPEEVVW